MLRTILLADDSVTIQKVVELTFMDEDYEVDAVGDGTTALARLDSRRPDLLIADVHMPGADGYEVCRQAKAKHPDLPVLLLVGTFEPFDESRAAAAGANGHLKKPFDAQDLQVRVAELISGAAGAAGSDAEDEAEILTDLPPLEAGIELEPIADVRSSEMPAETPAATEAPPSDSPFATSLHRTAFPEELLDDLDEDVQTTSFDTASLEKTRQSSRESFAIEDNHPTQELEVDVEPVMKVAELSPEPAVETAAEAPTMEAPVAEEAPVAASNGGPLDAADVDRIAHRVVELLGDGLLREVAWEVVPDLAEVVIKERLRELESQVE